MIFLLAGIVLFAAGARIGHFLLLGIIAVPVAWREVVTAQYRLARMLTFLSPGADLSEANWQVTQSMIGIGAGRLFGVGFGQGLQKLGYLPYAYSDFLFSERVAAYLSAIEVAAPVQSDRTIRLPISDPIDMVRSIDAFAAEPDSVLAERLSLFLAGRVAAVRWPPGAGDELRIRNDPDIRVALPYFARLTTLLEDPKQ